MLTINNVNLSHDGTYQVTITDDVGTIVSSPVRLNVLLAPLIVVPPASVSVVTGATFVVSIAVSGNPLPIGFEWRQASVPRGSNTVYSTVHYANFVAPTTLVTNQLWRVIVRNLANTNFPASAQFLVSTLADSDGDGIPDIWESDRGLDPANPDDSYLDLDGDGMTNWQEYLAGTDPNDAGRVLRLDMLSLSSGVALSFAAVSNRTYTVQYTDDLGSGLWSTLADVVARTSNRVERITDPNFTPSRVYRIATPRQP
jgi:hypothetical protein